jgi:AcrR family transcriptional regulator
MPRDLRLHSPRPVSAAGRRPGKADTRGEIVEAATRVFAAKGYDGTSLRAVAREAGVDPALVHHYFDGKASLFVAAMALPIDPRRVKEQAQEREHGGANVVEGFLAMWDGAEGSGSSFASCAAAMAASPNVADAMREFLEDRIWSVTPSHPGESEALTKRRLALVSSQLMGLAFTRYVMRVPPLSTATPAQIAHWVGPTLERYMNEPLD